MTTPRHHDHSYTDELFEKLDRGEDLSAYLVEHPELRKEVEELKNVTQRFEEVRSTLPEPSRERLKALLENHAPLPAHEVVRSLPSPFWSAVTFSGPAVAFALLLLIFSVDQTLPGGENVALESDSMMMKSMSAPASDASLRSVEGGVGGGAEESMLFSTMPAAPSEEGTADAIVASYDQSFGSEYARASEGDQDFSYLTADTTELSNFITTYDDPTI